MMSTSFGCNHKANAAYAASFGDKAKLAIAAGAHGEGPIAVNSATR
jgi:hypothetical protein